MLLNHRTARPYVRAAFNVVRMCFMYTRCLDSIQAFGISSPEVEPPPSPPSRPVTAAAHPVAQDLPAFLQASLGVKGGRGGGGGTPPFLTASTVSEVVKVATAPAAPGCSSPAAAGSAQAAAVEGLLGVLAAGEAAGGVAAAVPAAGVGRGSAGTGDGTGAEGDDDLALATVKREGLSLLLAAFSGFGGGGGRAEDRLWRDCGAPVLEKIVVAAGEASPSASASAERVEGNPPRRRSVWRDFLDGAVERTRRAMEDDGIDGGGAPDLAAPAPPAAERAATLAGALVELQGALARRGAAPPEEAPVLWRLGLTSPSVWRQRRQEALAGRPETGATAAATATVTDLARACVGSRWARRWECVSVILARLPDVRSRLSLLTEGVVTADGVDGDGGCAGYKGAAGAAGEALSEILAAGVVMSRAERLLEGKAYGGMATGDRVSVDLPRRLLSPPAAASAAVSRGGTRGFDPVEEFGLGLPSFRGFLPAAVAAMDQPGASAAVASAGVLDAAAVHLGKNAGAFKTTSAAQAGEAKPSAAAERADSRQQQQQQQQQKHPFSLLLPQGLWRAAFAPPAPAPGDARLHGVLVSALLSAVTAMAEDYAAGPDGGGAGVGEEAAGAWLVSCSAEVSAGLVVAVVGETFARGLGLGDYANRCVCVWP